jgi:hypothetical protein
MGDLGDEGADPRRGEHGDGARRVRLRRHDHGHDGVGRLTRFGRCFRHERLPAGSLLHGKHRVRVSGRHLRPVPRRGRVVPDRSELRQRQVRHELQPRVQMPESGSYPGDGGATSREAGTDLDAGREPFPGGPCGTVTCTSGQVCLRRYPYTGGEACETVPSACSLTDCPYAACLRALCGGAQEAFSYVLTSASAQCLPPTG